MTNENALEENKLTRESTNGTHAAGAEVTGAVSELPGRHVHSQEMLGSPIVSFLLPFCFPNALREGTAGNSSDPGPPVAEPQ